MEIVRQAVKTITGRLGALEDSMRETGEFERLAALQLVTDYEVCLFVCLFGGASLASASCDPRVCMSD